MHFEFSSLNIDVFEDSSDEAGLVPIPEDLVPFNSVPLITIFSEPVCFLAIAAHDEVFLSLSVPSEFRALEDEKHTFDVSFVEIHALY